jgi:Mg/Co/Ni transporter MgtE
MLPTQHVQHFIEMSCITTHTESFQKPSAVVQLIDIVSINIKIENIFICPINWTVAGQTHVYLIPASITLKTLGKDPALGSGPLATALQDIISVLIYFLFAVLLIK